MLSIDLRLGSHDAEVQVLLRACNKRSTHARPVLESFLIRFAAAGWAESRPAHEFPVEEFDKVDKPKTPALRSCLPDPLLWARSCPVSVVILFSPPRRPTCSVAEYPAV